MRALVLFKGTGSIDKELTDAGWELDSLDILKKFEPTSAISKNNAHPKSERCDFGSRYRLGLVNPLCEFT